MIEARRQPGRSDRVLDLLDRAELPLLGLWIGLAAGLSVLTGKVRDWFVMTDELRYERLAASIAHTHSLLPRIHGELVESWAQLYPLVIAPAFRHADMPADVHAAHLVNAAVMSSACIPAFLLARRVLGARRPAYVVAGLTVAMPWIVYSTMLMTEVVAYPAFVWAAFAMHRSIATPSRGNDVLALMGIAVAFLARTALLTLVFVLPLAIIAFEARRGRLREVWRRHDVLAGVYAVLIVVAVALKATGDLSRIYGIYGHYTGSTNVFSSGYFGSLFEHYATFSLALGILPVLLAVSWVFANVIRPARASERHAFACLAGLTMLVLPLQVTNFDLVYGFFVHDRFLIYLLPLVLIGALCAVLDEHSPRWSLVAPAAVLIMGYATGAIPAFTWQQFETLNADTPASTLYRPLVELTGGLTGTRVLLAAATVLFAVAILLLPRVALRSLAVAYMVIVLPLVTWFMFDRMFAAPGWSGRPVTAQAHGTFDWIDTAVGADAEATIVPYPVWSEWFVSQGYWRDLEFWNRAVVRDLHYPAADAFEYTGFWFPKLDPRFDGQSGAVADSPTRYVVQSDSETRFRIAGPVRASAPSGVLIDAGTTWRLDWLSQGLYDDGWTRPHVRARVRVYPSPGQSGAVIRYLGVGLGTPGGVETRHVDFVSNVDAWHGDVPRGETVHEQIKVCVPPRRYGEVTIATPGVSTIPGDARSLAASEVPRQGGVLLTSIGLADETGGSC